MADNQASKEYNDHNVYIVGAGFAAEAGLPLINDFMSRMRNAPAWLEKGGGREREVAAIRNVLAFRGRSKAAAEHVPLNLDNVEELFSLASTVMGQAGTSLAEDVNLAISATLDFARSVTPPPKEHEYFHIGVLKPHDAPSSWNRSPEYVENMLKSFQERQWYACPPYQFYLGVMAGRFSAPSAERLNTIITFNYDTVIEDALVELEIPFSYGLWPHHVSFHSSARCVHERTLAHGVRVLKLHGSVNWRTSDPFSTNMTAYGSYGDLRQQEVILVPPTWHKGWDLGHPVSAVWDAAIDPLRTATRIIIIGYSVPMTDPHTKYLLAEGFQENISLHKVFIVNPDLQDEKRKKEHEGRLFVTPGLFRHERLEQGMIELIPATTREFFETPMDIYSKPYRIRIGRSLGAGLPWENAPFVVSNGLNGFSAQ